MSENTEHKTRRWLLRPQCQALLWKLLKLVYASHLSKWWYPTPSSSSVDCHGARQVLKVRHHCGMWQLAKGCNPSSILRRSIFFSRLAASVFWYHVCCQMSWESPKILWWGQFLPYFYHSTKLKWLQLWGQWNFRTNDSCQWRKRHKQKRDPTYRYSVSTIIV